MEPDEANRIIQDLFHCWYGTLVRYGRRLCSDCSAVEDAAQESLLLLYRELREGTEVPNPRAWTLLVAKRTLGRFLKRRQRHVSIEDECGLLAGPPLSPDLTTETPSIEELFALLSPRETEVVLMRMQAMKYREIAKALEISPNTVNCLLARAIVKIRNWRQAHGLTNSEAVAVLLHSHAAGKALD